MKKSKKIRKIKIAYFGFYQRFIAGILLYSMIFTSCMNTALHMKQKDNSIINNKNTNSQNSNSLSPLADDFYKSKYIKKDINRNKRYIPIENENRKFDKAKKSINRNTKNREFSNQIDEAIEESKHDRSHGSINFIPKNISKIQILDNNYNRFISESINISQDRRRTRDFTSIRRLSDSETQVKMFEALISKDYEKLKKYLKVYSPNIYDKETNSLLHIACINNDLVGTEILLRHGADISFKNKKGLTPLVDALNRGNFKIIDLFKKYSTFSNILKSNKNSNNNNNTTRSISSKIYKKKKSIDFKDTRKAGSMAVQKKMFELLISKKYKDLETYLKTYSPNIFEKETKNSLLHISCLSDDLIGTNLLLRYGADCYLKNNKGLTPFMQAFLCKNYSFIDVFKKYPYLLTDTSFKGKTPLYHSYTQNNLALFNKLLQEGADTNQVIPCIKLPMLFKTLLDNNELFTLSLIKNGNTNIWQECQTINPMQIIIKRGNIGFLKKLFDEWKFLIDISSERYSKLLLYALEYNRYDIFDYIINNNAIFNFGKVSHILKKSILNNILQNKDIKTSLSLIAELCYKKNNISLSDVDVSTIKNFLYNKGIMEHSKNLTFGLDLLINKFNQRYDKNINMDFTKIFEFLEYDLLEKSILENKNNFANLLLAKDAHINDYTQAKQYMIQSYMNDNFNLFKKLLNKGIHPDAYKSKNNANLLFLACKDKKPNFANELLKFGANPEIYIKKEKTGFNSIQMMVKNGMVETLKLAFQTNPFIKFDRRDKFGRDLYNIAYDNNQLEMMQYLLQNNLTQCHVDACKIDRFTLLMRASIDYKPRFFELFIKYGADPNKINETNHSVIDFILRSHNPIKLLEILKENTQVKINDKEIEKILNFAYDTDNIKLFKSILNSDFLCENESKVFEDTISLQKKKIIAKNKVSKNLLNKIILKQLSRVEKKAEFTLGDKIQVKYEPSLKNNRAKKINVKKVFIKTLNASKFKYKNKNNFLHQAILDRKYKFIDTLLQEGFDINEPDKQGFSAQHYALRSNDKKLIEKFVSFNNSNNNNSTKSKTLLYAFRSSNFEAVNSLLENKKFQKELEDNIAFYLNEVLPILVKNNEIEKISILLKSQAGPFYKLKQTNASLFDYALKNNKPKILELILRLAANNELYNKHIQNCGSLDFKKDTKGISPVLDAVKYAKKMQPNLQKKLYSFFLNHCNNLLQEATVIDEDNKNQNITLLEQIVKHKNYIFFEEILKQKQINIAKIYFKKDSFISHLLKSNDTKLLDIFLTQSKMDLLKEDENNKILLEIASQIDSIDSFNKILELTDVKKLSEEKISKIAFSLLTKPDFLTLFLLKGINIDDIKDENQKTLFEIACNKKLSKTKKLLLQFGANPDSFKENNKTLLRIAFEENNLNEIKLLLKHGAEIKNTLDENNNTILTLSLISNNTNLQKVLLTYASKKDLYQENKNNVSPFKIIAANNNLDLLNHFILSKQFKVPSLEEFINGAQSKENTKDNSNKNNASELDSTKINIEEVKPELEEKVDNPDEEIKPQDNITLNLNNNNSANKPQVDILDQEQKIIKILDGKNLVQKKEILKYILLKSLIPDRQVINKRQELQEEDEKESINYLKNPKDLLTPKIIDKLFGLIQDKELAPQIFKIFRSSPKIDYNKNQISVLEKYLDTKDIATSQDIIFIFNNHQKLQPKNKIILSNQSLDLLQTKAFEKELSHCIFKLLNTITENNDIKLNNKFIDKFTAESLDKTLEKKPLLLKEIKAKISKLTNLNKYKIIRFLVESPKIYPQIIQKEPAKLWKKLSLKQLLTESYFSNEDQKNEQKDEIDFKRYAFENINSQFREIEKIYDEVTVERLYDAISKISLSLDLSLADISKALQFVIPQSQQIVDILINQNSQLLQTSKEEFFFALKNISFRNILSKNAKLNLLQKQKLLEITSIISWEPPLTLLFLEKTKTENFEAILYFIQRSLESKVDYNLLESIIKQKNGIKAWNLELDKSKLKKLIQKLRLPKYKSIEHDSLRILSKGCRLGILEKLIDIYSKIPKNDEIDQNFAGTLNILFEYGTDQKTSEYIINKLIKDINPKDWEKATHKLTIEKTFVESKVRTVKEILAYIKSKAPKDIKYIHEGRLEKDLKKLEEAINGKSKILNIRKSIKKWNEKDIKKWAIKVRGKDFINKQSKVTVLNKNLITKNLSIHEIMAVVTRALQLHKKYSPYSVQTISLLTLLNTKPGKGRLAQINTGEGKSTIVAMLAAIKVLLGHTVDVVTTSTELSVPEVEEIKPFFEMLNMTVAENSTVTASNVKGKTEIYHKDIVYGTTNTFLGDILHDEYNQKNFRTKRKFDFVIIDEVDSLHIDGNSSRVQLTSPKPAMNYLAVVLARIWNYIGDTRTKIQQHQEIDEKTHKVTTKYRICIKNLKDPKSDNNLETEYLELPNNDPQEFIRNSCIKHMKVLFRELTPEEEKEYAEKIILDKKHYWKKQSGKPSKKTQETILKELNELSWTINNRKPVMDIPVHLRGFARKQIENWVENGVRALYMKRGQNYQIINNKIIPIDYKNTGVFKPNMVWGDGLTQFLEIKEGLPISSESLAPSFISNIEFFSRYKTNLLGLTGTLGSEYSKKLLAELYKVDNIIIPPRKNLTVAGNENSKYICKELVPIVKSKEYEWQKTIVNSIISKLRNQRGILIICESLNVVNQLYDRFLDEKSNYKFIKYTGEESFKKKSKDGNQDSSDNASEDFLLHKKIYPGQCIIATNISGRGTDIKPIKVPAGMHVCVTFLPDNLRVELQNVGRTARKGEQGTAQLIIFDSEGRDMETLKKIRDEEEQEKLKYIKTEFSEMKFRDQLFQKFSKLRSDIFKKNVESLEAKALEERWAMWFQHNVDSTSEKFDKHKISSSYDEFEKEILDSKRQKYKVISNNSYGAIIKNPHFFIKKGNRLFFEHSPSSAMQYYREAINVDPLYNSLAYYNLAFAKLSAYPEYDSDYFSEVISNLECARVQLDICYYPLLNQINAFTSRGNKKTALSEQIQRQFDVLGAFDENIRTAESTLSTIRTNESDAKVKWTHIDDVFSNKERNYDNEIYELVNNGLQNFYSIEEVKNIPWFDVIAVAAIGIGQILLGAAITVLSCGAATTYGMSFINEGINDLLTAFDIINSKEFSWEQWGLKKAISYMVSLTCNVIETFRDICKKGAKGIQKAYKLSKDTIKGLTKNTFKKIGLQVAKKGLNKLAGVATDILLSKTIFKGTRLVVENVVKEHIEKAIRNSSLIKKAIEIDKINGDNKWQNLIFSEGMKILNNPKNKSTFDKFTEGVCTGLLNKGASAALGYAKKEVTKEMSDGLLKSCAGILIQSGVEEAQLLYATQQIFSFTEFFTGKLNKKLDYYKSDIIKETKIKQATINDRNSVNDNNNHNNNNNNNNDVFDEKEIFVREQEKIRNSNLRARTLESSSVESIEKRFCSLVTNRLNNNFANKFEGLVQNYSSYGLDKIFENSEIALKAELETLQTRAVACRLQHGQPKSSKKNKNNANFKRDNDELNKQILNLKNGKSKGNIIDLALTAKSLKKKIIVYKEDGEEIVFGAKETGGLLELNYESPSSSNQNKGHWTLRNEKENYKSTGGNNCLFDAISSEIGMSAQEQRERIAAKLSEPDTYNLLVHKQDLLNTVKNRNDGSFLQGGYSCPNLISVDSISEDSIGKEFVIDGVTYRYVSYEDSIRHNNHPLGPEVSVLFDDLVKMIPDIMLTYLPIPNLSLLKHLDNFKVLKVLKNKNFFSKLKNKGYDNILNFIKVSTKKILDKTGIRAKGIKINLNKIFKPNGSVIGKQVANNSQIRTISKSKANEIIKSLMDKGAKQVKAPGTYKGKWYELPDGKQFGIRTSNYKATLKHGTPNTLDLEQLDLKGILKLKYD